MALTSVRAGGTIRRESSTSRAAMVPGRSSLASATTLSMKSSSWLGSWWNITSCFTLAASASRTPSCQVEWPQPTYFENS